nr:polymerase PB2 [Influenza D virus]
MSLLLTLAKEYANLTKDKKSCKLLSQGTVSSYTTFKKWTTSRKEKNPSLRMRWAMGSKFPIMANREILEEAGIPEQWEGIDLWSKKDDVSKLGMVLASPAAITYWNFCGPGVDNSSVIRDVYKAKFMKKERWRETLWGPMNFELVGKQRRMVETQPVEIKLNQKEIKELTMWVLFEDEANLASKFIQENFSLVLSLRELYKGKAVNKDVAAFMIAHQFSPEKRFLPTFGPIRPERMELLHCLGGDFWKIEAVTAGSLNEEQKKRDVRAVARKICLRASVDLFTPAEKIRDYISSVTMRFGTVERTFEDVIRNSDDISAEVTLCKAALGCELGKSMNFGNLNLRKVSGEAETIEKTVYWGLKPIKYKCWRGEETFYCELRKVTCMFRRSEGLDWANIGPGSPEERRELLAMVMIFCRDGRFFESAPVNIDESFFRTRLNKEIPYQYVLLKWVRQSRDNLDALLSTRGLIPAHIGQFGKGMGIDGSSSSSMVYKGVMLSKTPIDIVESKEKHRLFLNDNIEAITERGAMVASIMDLSEDNRETFNDVTFNHVDLAVLKDEKTAIIKIYRSLVERINTDDDGLPALIMGKRYLELYQLDEVKDAVGLIPKRMLGAYSYQARQLIQSQIKNDSYSLPEIIKLLPFCYSPPKKMLFDGTFHFKNQMYVRPGINTNLFSFSKTDKSKIYVNGSAVKIKLVLGDDEMDTSLAFVEGFQVCEYDPRAPLIPRRDLRLIGFGKKVRVFVGQGQEKTLVRTSSKRAASHDVSKNIRRMRLEV